MRNPNTVCSNCRTPIYRRPNQLKSQDNVYCCRECHVDHKGFSTSKNRICEYEGCGTSFKPPTKRAKYCSHTCSNKARRGIFYSKDNFQNKSKRKLFEFTQTCNQKSCAIEGCDYDKTYDMHRVVPGRLGGKYEIGNMFALCPNHHAEIERGMLQVEVVDQCTLRKELP